MSNIGNISESSQIFYVVPISVSHNLYDKVNLLVLLDLGSRNWNTYLIVEINTYKVENLLPK